jgi:hypothetical protein
MKSEIYRYSEGCNNVSALPGDVAELYRDRRASISTQQTEHTERFEIEESTEFLPAIDNSSSHIMEDLDYQVHRQQLQPYHGGSRLSGT